MCTDFHGLHPFRSINDPEIFASSCHGNVQKFELKKNVSRYRRGLFNRLTSAQMPACRTSSNEGGATPYDPKVDP